MKTYQVELAASAKADLREAMRWISRDASPAAAGRWLAKLHKVIRTLERQPLRCPLADESDQFPEEIRVLLHGKRRKAYRVVFTVRDEAVVVLYIRHDARDELNP